jgi:NAD(P)-dependent dehydrogenase (short-subunit alcohol dehydrogenase family)
MAIRSAYWQGKCAIVTGGSSGIGRALAKHLVERGARVGLIARRAERLADLAREIRASGGATEFRSADVAQAASLAAAVGELERSLGACDVAVACAGIYRATLVDRLDPAVIADVMATNILGVSNLFSAVLPGMLQRSRGHLAAVASIAGYLGLSQSGAYCASKAAVITLLQSLRLDLAPRGIGVTTISPGYVDTPMITDEERRTIRGLLSAEDTARRIALAIERCRAEVAFPWSLYSQARGASLLPWWIYRLAVGNVPPLEEVEQT